MRWMLCKEIGEECGMFTVGEQLANIQDHATMLFEYSKINAEIKELIEDATACGIDVKAEMKKYMDACNANNPKEGG